MWEPYGPDMAYVSLCKDININFAFASCIIGHFSFHNILAAQKPIQVLKY